jgi:thioredoxin-like negative regulator of GroEL
LLGLLLEQRGQLVASITEFRAAGNSDEVRLHLATALARKGDRADALSVLDALPSNMPANIREEAEQLRAILQSSHR